MSPWNPLKFTSVTQTGPVHPSRLGRGLPGALPFSSFCFYPLQVKMSIVFPLQKLPSALTMELSLSSGVFSDFYHVSDPAGSCPAGNQRPPGCAPPWLTESALALRHSPSEQRRNCSFCPACLKLSLPALLAAESLPSLNLALNLPFLSSL